MATGKQLNWTADMEFLLLGSIHGHKAHVYGGSSLWKTVSMELDRHPDFHQNSAYYAPLTGTAKASAKYNRLLDNFKKVYGEDTATIKKEVRGKFSREEELLCVILTEKNSSERAKSAAKQTSSELQEKFRRQDLTHGLEAGHRTVDEETPDEIDEEDQLLSDDEELRPKKRRRNKKSGTVQESVEYKEHKTRMDERARIREEERRLRHEREMKALEESTAYNRRAEERQIQSLDTSLKALDIATATLEVTQKLLENSGMQSAALGVQSAALGKILERL